MLSSFFRYLPMNNISPPKRPLWKSKAVIFATIFSFLFLLFFYMAVTNEPDYMPSQQNKPTAHTESEHSNHDKQMSDQQMKNMPHNDSHTESSH